MKLVLLGAGAWGTALAVHAARRHDVMLWVRDPQQCRRLQAERVNERYLPGIGLPRRLVLTDDFDRAVEAVDADGLLLVATPMSGLREMLERAAARPGWRPAAGDGGHAAGAPALGWLCKGFQAGDGALGHEIARQVMPGIAPVVVSGPSFAIEVARGQPTALVAASSDDRAARRAVEALHDRTLRVYTSADPIGVEVGGAVKNVLAIATGIADGLPFAGEGVGAGSVPAGLGLNARAALITRGLAEMTRLGLAMGARVETFMGLSGLGDLVLTATGDLSRNRQVGLALARGVPLPRILEDLGHVAEGVRSAPVVRARAQRLGVEMPITEAVVDVLSGTLTPAAALQRLMERDARAEGP